MTLNFFHIRAQYGRVYYGIDRGMYCATKLNLNNRVAYSSLCHYNLCYRVQICVHMTR